MVKLLKGQCEWFIPQFFGMLVPLFLYVFLQWESKNLFTDQRLLDELEKEKLMHPETTLETFSKEFYVDPPLSWFAYILIFAGILGYMFICCLYVKYEREYLDAERVRKILACRDAGEDPNSKKFN